MLQAKTKVGELDREVTFIQPIYEQGISSEDKITGWEVINDYNTVSAKKIENGGNTFVQSERITWSQQTTWVIRWRDDLNIRMRLVWDTKVYQIINLADTDEGRRRFLTVTTNLLDNEFWT